MKIDRLVLGEFETNCYVVRTDGSAADCLVVDTGMDVTGLLDFLRRNKLNPITLILTHGHIDHIAGVNALRSRFPDIKIYIHKLDADLLSDSVGNLSFMTGCSFTAAQPASCVEEGDIIGLAGIKLQVIHTPGHTQGGICLYAKEDGVAFVGDTLFAGSVGRTDFPTGNMRQLIQSVKDKLLILPAETKVYPGHGSETTIANEKAHNPFL
jgi:hydroxyacylglutathione hydrolase